MLSKLSSRTESVPLAGELRKMLGLITVARLCRSILFPVSSSTCEKEATHFKKVNKTSTVSRLPLGSRSVTKCKQRLRSTSLVKSKIKRKEKENITRSEINCKVYTRITKKIVLTLSSHKQPIKFVRHKWFRK